MGTARRALRIEVTDPDVRQRFGIDHYYELHVFLPLQQPLRLIDATDGKTHTYGSFPCTICLRQLPPEVPEGVEIRHLVRVTGWFMKLWSYRSQLTEPAGDGPADRVRCVTTPDQSVADRDPRAVRIRAPPRHPASGLLLAGGFLAAVAVIGMVARWYRRSDRAFAQWKHRRLPDSTIPDPRQME